MDLGFVDQRFGRHCFVRSPRWIRRRCRRKTEEFVAGAVTFLQRGGISWACCLILHERPLGNSDDGCHRLCGGSRLSFSKGAAARALAHLPVSSLHRSALPRLRHDACHPCLAARPPMAGLPFQSPRRALVPHRLWDIDRVCGFMGEPQATAALGGMDGKIGGLAGSAGDCVLGAAQFALVALYSVSADEFVIPVFP